MQAGGCSCIFILSTKSAGSSVLQETIASRTALRPVARTRHFENETLYWTKAASVLGLPQIQLPMSEVPIPAARAARELVAFLSENGVAPPGSALTERSIIDGFRDLCAAQGGLMLEKSPHHLYQIEAIRLMERFADAHPALGVRFLGLARNPLDTFYSSWRRFGVPPDQEERVWAIAYRNLRDLAARRPDQVRILRYEDVVSGTLDVATLLREIGIDIEDDRTAPALHARSVSKWRGDAHFGHVLSPETAELARAFGYTTQELEGRARPWGFRDEARHLAFRAYGCLPEAMRQSLSRARRAMLRRA
ncbi:sulfotransferase [Limibaculum sp. FT325]|uniref:sulfotransferase n=1 Tax=Thermohalobaculum sediminis TaxID=2939436 RepID=UPI0020BDA0FC|nr:sulfotransferase [Limibaculum sediminis]MCL5777574.1 sulfotransferase [Limibaculum sediminis]